ncbi:glycosyltransferase [Polynucleobacter paneuropaeus]|nr:glycosyltransferase [Polynucleobacter paneuropaeus]
MSKSEVINETKVNDILWRVEGPFDSSYSLALLNREFSRALSALGVRVALFSTEGPGDFEPSDIFLQLNPDLNEMHIRSKQVSQSTASIVSRNLYPPRVNDMTGKISLLHSYAWEETAFPAEWVDNFNKYLTGLTCLSSHVMRAMQNNGVYLPMSVSGCGVDHWEHVVADSPSQLLSDGTKSFKFLHVSSFFPRKGPDVLLEAYGRSFTGDDDVILVIKTFPNPHNRIHEQLMQMREKFSNYPSVLVIERDFTDGEMKALYSQCDVLVAPSCAEGFGLPLAEAMLSGLPVITTGWSGQMDFCNEENSWLVDYKFEQANTHFQLTPSAWAACDVDGLRSAMQLSFNTSPEIRKSMAAKGRELLLKDFTWESVAKRSLSYFELIKALPESIRRSEPSIGWVTTWNTKCGIATYSEHLIAGMLNKPYIFAPISADLLHKDGPLISRCWEGDKDSLQNLALAVNSKNIDVLIIQFNFGFFDQEYLHIFINEQKFLGHTVIIEMHSTMHPTHAPEKNLSTYRDGLKLADRVLAHTITDMNRLKSIGLEDNVALFPHGALDISQTENDLCQVPTIATYGFCLPHKGLLEVIQAIGFLRDAGKIVHLKMINAIYPADISLALAEEIRLKINLLNLEGQIDFQSAFLADEDSISLLQSSDLIIYAYLPTTESSSGAARYGLACGKPVLVTDISIFEEFGESVWRTRADSVECLAADIWRVLGEIRSNSDEYISRKSLSKVWRKQHSYSTLSRRLENMAKGLNQQKAINL